MKNPRKKSFTPFIIVIAALTLLYFLNNGIPQRNMRAQVAKLISKHKGAIVFLTSDKEKDIPFKKALKEIRTELKGKAGIVIANRGNEEGLSPTLIIVDAHGKELHRFVNSFDRKILDELVLQLSTHQH